MPTLDQIYGRPQLGRAAVLAAGRQIPQPEDELAADEGLPEVNPSLVSRMGSFAGGALGAAANILDLPGSSFRDVLAGDNPFDQWWTPTRPDNRNTGRDLARKWGMAGDEDTWGNFLGGLGAEIALDPMTYTGIGLLTKAGTTTAKAGLLGSAKKVANQTAEQMARQSGKTMGKKKLGTMGARMRLTPRQLIEGADDVADAKRKWLETRGRLSFKDTDVPRSVWEPVVDAEWNAASGVDDLLDKPLQSILSFRMPGLMKEPLELTRDPSKSKSSIQKFVDKNAEPAPPGFQLPPGASPPPGAGGPTPGPGGPTPGGAGPGPTPGAGGTGPAPGSSGTGSSPTPGAGGMPPGSGGTGTPPGTGGAGTPPGAGGSGTTPTPGGSSSGGTGVNPSGVVDDFSKLTLADYHKIADPDLRRRAYQNLWDDNGVYFSGVKVNPQRHKDEIQAYLNLEHAALTRNAELAVHLEKRGVPVETAVKSILGSDASPMTYKQLHDFFTNKKLDLSSSDLAQATGWKPKKPTQASTPSTTASTVIRLAGDGKVDVAATDSAFEAISPRHAQYNESLKTWRNMGVLTSSNVAFIQGAVQDLSLENLPAFTAKRLPDGSDEVGRAAGWGRRGGEWRYEIGLNKAKMTESIAEIPREAVALHETAHLMFYRMDELDPDLYAKMLGAAQSWAKTSEAKEFFKNVYGDGFGKYFASEPIETLVQVFAETISGRGVPNLPKEVATGFRKVWKDVVDYVKRVLKFAPANDPRLDTIREIVKFVGGTKDAVTKDELLKALDGVDPFIQKSDDLGFKSNSFFPGAGQAVGSARQKFVNLAAAGKQKVVDKLKDLMDEDVAVAAADTLDDVGSGLYRIPGAATMVALFSAPVRGGLNETGRDIGRETYQILQDAQAGARERIDPIVRAFEESGLFDENKLIAAGKTKEQAVDILNERDSLIRQFLEYDHTKSKRPMPALTPELAALTPQLNQIRGMLDDILDVEVEAGLDAKALQDEFINYVMRYRRFPGKHYRHNPTQGSVVEVSHSALNNREFRDMPGGVKTLQDMSLDPMISGIVHLDPVIKGKIENADWPRLRDHVALKYGDELEDGFDITKFDPDTDTRFDNVIRSMANLDPYHIQDKMPIYGRSLLDDLARRMEDGVRVSQNAKTAQMLLGRAAVPADVARGKVYTSIGQGATEAEALAKDQAVSVTKVLKDLEFTKGRAWENTVKQMTPEARAQRDGMIAMRDAEVAALPPGDSIVLETIDHGHVTLTRDASGDLVRDVTPAANKKKGAKPNMQVVAPDELEEFIRQEQNYKFLDEFAVDRDIHTQVTKWIKPFSNPDEVNNVVQMLNRFINVTKSSWTAPWPAFHMRNLFSGQVQNAMMGAHDPTTKNPVMRLFKPVMQAHTLRNGETIEGIAKEIKLFDGMTDEQATRKLSELAFKFGVTGDKMGLAAEHIGQSHQALKSQMPGLNKEVQPLGALQDLFTGNWGNIKNRFSPAPYGTTAWDAANPLAVRDGVGVGREGVINYTEDMFLPSRIGRDVSSYVEDLNRLSPFIAFMKQGYSPAEAAKMAKKLQVDYTKLSAFERKYARLAMPFYSFSRGMLPTVAEELIHNPGGPMGQTLRVLNRSRSDDAMVPDYIGGTAAIPFGEKPDGTKSYVTGLGLAFEDSLNLMEGVLRMQPEMTAKELLSRSNPLIKGTIEGVTGRSLYFDGPGGSGRELTEMDPPIGRTLSNIRDLATGQRTEEAEPFINSRFEFLMANSPAARAITTARTLTDPRKVVDRPIDTALNLLTGFRVRDLSPSAQDYSYRERIAEALKDSGAREFRRSYLPDARADRLDEEERDIVNQMLAELGILDKRQKIRRQQAEAEQAPPNQKIQTALFK